MSISVQRCGAEFRLVPWKTPLSRSTTPSTSLEHDMVICGESSCDTIPVGCGTPNLSLSLIYSPAVSGHCRKCWTRITQCRRVAVSSNAERPRVSVVDWARCRDMAAGLMA